MNIGIVGSRQPTQAQVETIKNIIKDNPKVTIVSGGAMGTDFEAFFWKLKQYNEDIKKLFLLEFMPPTYQWKIDRLKAEILRNEFGVAYKVFEHHQFKKFWVRYKEQLIIQIFVPDFDAGFDIRNYHIRNKKIVEGSDKVYIFKRKGSRNRGGISVQAFCVENNKPFKIVWDNGEIKTDVLNEKWMR